MKTIYTLLIFLSISGFHIASFSQTITGDSATNITFYSVKLNGTANPSGIPTAVSFEFGTDTTYGYTVNAVPDTLTGYTPIAFESEITGIAAATTYHFRVKTENCVGVFYGGDRTFTTISPPAGNFTFTPERTVNQVGVYTDISGVGTIIPVDNYDNCHSQPVNIGFNFQFAGATFIQFVLNSNGFIKLGNIHPADSAQFFSLPRGFAGDMGGIFSSPHFANVFLISPFNNDLDAGSNPAEFRVFTEGTPGNRICIIQFKNLREKVEPPDHQFDNLEFQIRLHESGVVEFVYGTWQPSEHLSAWRAAGVGLKGTSTANNQLITVTKGSMSVWQNATFNPGNYCSTCYAFNYGNAPRPLPEPGRSFSFYPKVAHDAAVVEVYTLGKLPVPIGLPHTVKAYIKNSGYDTLTNVPVQLEISGQNQFSAVDTIHILKPDSGFTVGFPGFTPSALGYNTVNITLPGDDYLPDNSKNYAQEITLNQYAYFDTVPFGSGIGFTWGGQPGSPAGLWLVKYHVNSVKNINAARIGLGSGVGQNVYAVALNASGQIIALSVNYPLTAANSWKYHTFDFPNPPVIPCGDFYIGLAQTLSPVTYYPIGAQEENPTRRGTYYTADINGGVVTESVGGTSRFVIEAIMDSDICKPVISNNCYNNYIDDFITTGGITNISNLHTDCSGNPNNYSYFPNQIVSAEQGTPFSFNASGLFYYYIKLAIWVDWNNDGDFNDAGELAFNAGNPSSSQFSGTILVPMTSTTGDTRMRVLLYSNEGSYIPDPCGWYSNGETEDYRMNVLPASPMTYQSGTTFQCDTLIPASRGRSNIPVIGMEMDVAGVQNPLVATSFNLSSSGCTNFAHDVSQVRVYYTGGNSVFSPDQLFGSVANLSSTVTGAATLSYGKNYFWVTYDISDSATIGNFIDAACLSYTISGSGTHIPTITSPPGKLMVDYCIPEFAYPGGCYYYGYGIESFFTYGGTTNISNFDNGCSNPQNDYTKFSNQFLTISQGASFEFMASCIQSEVTFQVYADWNQDSDFDDPGELLYNNWGAMVFDTVFVPADAVPGVTRLRVIAFLEEPWFQPTPSAQTQGPGCQYIFGYGETEDYMVNVLAGSPMTYQNGAVFQCDTLPFPTRGSLNNKIIWIKINVTGTLNPLSVTSFTLNSIGSSDFVHDVSLVKIYYTGHDSTFSTNHPFGSSADLNSPVSGNLALSNGTNFFWVTFDVRDTATVGNYLDASCLSYSIAGSGSLVPVPVAPAGRMMIDYCIPTFGYHNGCYIAGIASFLTTGGATNISNLNNGCPANLHDYSGFTSQVVTGQQDSAFQFSITSTGNSLDFYIFIDWNHDFDFDDPNEMVYYFPGVEVGGEIAIPADALTGTTRLRVISAQVVIWEPKSPGSTSPGCFSFEGNGETEDYSIKVTPAFPINTTLQNITVANGRDTCFDALQTIAVAGSGTTFIVQNGGGATLIAGQKISFLPGSKVNHGGYLHGYISQNGSWCNMPATPALMANGGDEKSTAIVSKADGFKVYPNPTTGKFVLELAKNPSEFPASVKIYDMLGSMIMASEIRLGRTREFSLNGKASGVYLIKVLQDNEFSIGKVVMKDD